MEKPKKPIEPNFKNYPTPKEPNAVNCYGIPLYQKLDWIKDYKKYVIDVKKYDSDLEVFEKIKFIKLIKNSTEKYCLKSLRITKR